MSKAGTALVIAIVVAVAIVAIVVAVVFEQVAEAVPPGQGAMRVESSSTPLVLHCRRKWTRFNDQVHGPNSNDQVQ